ncbi:ABC transporter transmembrane subunit [Streptomyces sp. Mg1]|nr:ABC transporter transmembrane subunit [Streptomyces sp. Mg1]
MSCRGQRKIDCPGPARKANLARFEPLTEPWGVMQISDLPYPDPGVPDARSGPRFLVWLGRGQLGGQLQSLGWGMVHFGGVAGLPYAVGLGVEAVVEHDGARLLRVGALLLLLGVAISLGDNMLHRTAVTNWITAAARVQQLLARKTAELGSALTRRVAAGEVVAVSTGDVEKIGWFVEAVSRFLAAAFSVVLVCVGLLFYAPAIGVVVAIGIPVVALAVLPLLPRATQRADVQREKAGRATELASDTVAGLRVLRGIGGEELFLGRYREASQEVRAAAVRSARMWAVISAIQVVLPGALLITVVWYGSALVLDGRLTVGQLVAAFSAVATMLYPLRHFEEIAMAYSFSRPSPNAGGPGAVPDARRRRGGGRAGGRARRRRGRARSGRGPVRPPDGAAGSGGAVHGRRVRRPRSGGAARGPARRTPHGPGRRCLGAAGRGRAGRPGAGHGARAGPRTGQGSGPAVRDPARAARRTGVRGGRGRGRAGGGAVRGRAGRAAAVGAGRGERPDGRADHRARPVAVRRPAPAARAGAVAGHRPGGAGAGRADLGGRLAHRGEDRGRDRGPARGTHHGGPGLLAAAAGPGGPGRPDPRGRGRGGRHAP